MRLLEGEGQGYPGEEDSRRYMGKTGLESGKFWENQENGAKWYISPMTKGSGQVGHPVWPENPNKGWAYLGQENAAVSKFGLAVALALAE